MTKMKDYTVIDLRRVLLAMLFISVTYFISIWFQSSLFVTFLVFLTVYLAPGFSVLIAFNKKNSPWELRVLIVASFLISTIIAVVVISLLIMWSTPVPLYSIGVICALLNLILLAFLGKSKRRIQVRASKSDYLIMILTFVIYGYYLSFFAHVPQLFTMDETTYITWARHALLNGDIYPINVSPTSSDIIAIIKGRFFWTLLVASFLNSTGLEAYNARLINIMFLPITAITSTLFIPQRRQKEDMLKISIFTIVAINPLLVLFSNFVLSDLAIGFYLLLAILFFARSFSMSNEYNQVSINLYNLFLSFSATFIAFLIKENVVIVLAMYLIIMYYALRYKINSSWKVLILLILFPMIYELSIDLPYVISRWFVKNEFVVRLTSRFILISPATELLGMFIPLPWKSSTLLSYNFYDYLDYLYRMLSPETSGFLVAAVGLILPLLLKVDCFNKDLESRVLIYLLMITLWIVYLFYLSYNCFFDIPRYFLYMIPILITITLTMLYEIFSNSKTNMVMNIALTLSALFLLSVHLLLALIKSGVSVGYGLSRITWSITILVIQLIIYIISIILVISCRKLAIRIVTSVFSSKKRYEIKINMKKIAYVMFIIIMFASLAHFSVYSVSNCYYFKENPVIAVNSIFSNQDLPNMLILSNFYCYMRPYVPDQLFTKSYLFPLPMDENEFFTFLKLAPNNTFIVLSQDPRITWYEYSSNYIKKCDERDMITQYDVKLIQNYQGIKIYSLINRIGLYSNNNKRINITSVKIYLINATTVKLEIKTEAKQTSRIFIVVGTVRFSKLLIADLKSGYNELTWFFPYRLEDGSGYGSYIVGMSKILIYDDSGKLLYEETCAPFKLTGFNLITWIMMLSCLIVFILITFIRDKI